MAVIWDALLQTLNKPTFLGAVSELVFFCAPLWVAVVVGLLIGWSWKPFGSAEGDLGETQLPIRKLESEGGERVEEEEEERSGACVTMGDLEWLWKLVEERDGGPAWVQMMDRALPTMSYRAWRRDTKGKWIWSREGWSPQCCLDTLVHNHVPYFYQSGPPEYRSRTVFEDVTPEIVRDFFWDDDSRIKLKWDDMLIYHDTLEQCPITGTMIVQWIRKFPFFCSDREYIIGRRIWKLDGSYYCVTKGVPHLSVPRRNKPRRVDLYYSSWCIRAIESQQGNGKTTACEVLLFHHEDMGIPREIAKLGIRQGMWGMVKKIEPGLRAYQLARKEGATHSPCGHIAQISTKVGAGFMHQLEPENDPSVVGEFQKDKQPQSLSKFLIIGGAIALVCTLDQGLLTKAMIVGVGRRFARQMR